MRRLIALCLLLLTASSSLEAAVGTLRDGRVHHEDLATAMAHANAAGGDHGHEDGPARSEHRHGKGHEHGTSSDHCTHHHGIAPVPSFSFLIFTETGQIDYDEAPVLRTSVAQALTHPPRA